MIHDESGVIEYKVQLIVLFLNVHTLKNTFVNVISALIFSKLTSL